MYELVLVYHQTMLPHAISVYVVSQIFLGAYPLPTKPTNSMLLMVVVLCAIKLPSYIHVAMISNLEYKNQLTVLA